MGKVAKEVDIVAIVPDRIEVPLVRADYSGMSDMFRWCFDIFLAITAVIFGALIKTEAVGSWVVFVIVASIAVFFLIVSLKYRKKAECANNAKSKKTKTS